MATLILVNIDSDYGLSHITWIDGGLSSTGPLGINLSRIWIKLLWFSLKKMHSKMSSTKWRLFLFRIRCVNQKTIDFIKPWTKFVRLLEKETFPWCTWNMKNCMICCLHMMVLISLTESWKFPRDLVGHHAKWLNGNGLLMNWTYLPRYMS